MGLIWAGSAQAGRREVHGMGFQLSVLLRDLWQGRAPGLALTQQRASGVGGPA